MMSLLSEQAQPFSDLGGIVLVDPVLEVDVSGKTLPLKSGDSYKYLKLIFATGSVPVVPIFISGYKLEGVKYIRKSYNYIKELKKKIDGVRNIVIVGGGFIGAEVAEQLALHPDKTVTIIESKSYCFNKSFSVELSTIATEKLKEANIHVHTPPVNLSSHEVCFNQGSGRDYYKNKWHSY